MGTKGSSSSHATWRQGKHIVRYDYGIVGGRCTVCGAWGDELDLECQTGSRMADNRDYYSAITGETQ